jgi:hypothetical protein
VFARTTLAAVLPECSATYFALATKNGITRSGGKLLRHADEMKRECMVLTIGGALQAQIDDVPEGELEVIPC